MTSSDTFIGDDGSDRNVTYKMQRILQMRKEEHERQNILQQLHLSMSENEFLLRQFRNNMKEMDRKMSLFDQEISRVNRRVRRLGRLSGKLSDIVSPCAT